MIFPYDHLSRLEPKTIFEFGSFDGKDAIELKKAFPIEAFNFTFNNEE